MPQTFTVTLQIVEIFLPELFFIDKMYYINFSSVVNYFKGFFMIPIISYYLHLFNVVTAHFELM